MEDPERSRLLKDPDSSKCSICSKPCTKYCGHCHKIYYCSMEHQKQDRRRHKPECFPMAIVTDPVKGRCVTATRCIKAGELILKDEELVCAPNGNILCTLPEFRPMCLTCFRILLPDIDKNHSCGTCGWPLCDIDCEKDPRHANYECKIFASAQIRPFTKAVDYDHIKVLRALLLSETNPAKWLQLLNLESHELVREKLPNCRKKTFETVMFIRSTCNLVQYDFKVINFVVGVFRVNAFGNHNWPMPATGKNGVRVRTNDGFREGTFLFYLSSMFAHNCIPNTRSFLTQEVSTNNNNKMESHFMKHLLATIDIADGDEIRISYIETRQGTIERRNILRRGYHFDCTCARCSDPTEFNLYFSALKCQHRTCSSLPENEKSGCILPKNSLDPKSPWQCNSCQIEISWEEVVNTIEEIQARIEDSKKLDDSFRNVLEYDRILKKYQGSRVHSNHWLMIDLEYDVIKCARAAFLECYGDVDVESADDGGTNETDLRRSWKQYLTGSVRSVEAMTNHCLSIGSVLRPGLSIFRGCLLFSLAQCRFILFEEAAAGLGDNDNLAQMKLDLMRAVEEARTILFIEPEGSEEYKIANEMYNVIVSRVKRRDLYFLKEPGPLNK